MPISSGHCVFEYLYRDASNYKVHRTLLLKGPYSDAFRMEILSMLSAEIYFIPQQVGLSPLQSELYAYSNGPTDDDHAWHEFVGLSPATPSDVAQLAVAGTISKLVERFRLVALWREDA
jgi:hypothetical protein